MRLRYHRSRWKISCPGLGLDGDTRTTKFARPARKFRLARTYLRRTNLHPPSAQRRPHSAPATALTAHPAFNAVQTLSRDIREQLRAQLQRLQEQRLALRRVDAAWSQAVIEDLIAGRRARWDAVLERSRERLGSIAPLLDRVGNRAVTIPDTRDARRVRADVETALRHLTSGGKWKRLGLVVPKPIKGCVYVKDEVLVDGQAASDVDRLQTVCD